MLFLISPLSFKNLFFFLIFTFFTFVRVSCLFLLFYFLLLFFYFRLLHIFLSNLFGITFLKSFFISGLMVNKLLLIYVGLLDYIIDSLLIIQVLFLSWFVHIQVFYWSHLLNNFLHKDFYFLGYPLLLFLIGGFSRVTPELFSGLVSKDTFFFGLFFLFPFLYMFLVGLAFLSGF